ncbi:MAG: phosphoenolpyruvate--protein phosphotransferase [Pseudomonadales bacterium]|jgi:phosphotransferase system enzyme I (PtsP)|nr:phosphoenolpyruvate--protein phosphotransferase [Pseudomonadales bacterium]MDP6469500.1 phosphoenolpyruvate--protein phosphotransferase [Pseudomonadales bacterium]MDP6827342.1 phosphoenolpyruvate--protein phosphotransferase [Pseudomonadales bacterium]MDP6971164.1 phosphoenolpyruvate--protein phosphotransferase [Pseudomonadales bacterium]
MLTLLQHIVQDVAAAPSFREALDLLVRDVNEALGTEVCSVYIRNAEDSGYLFAANEGLNREAVGKSTMRLGEGLVGLVGGRAEPVNLEDAVAHPQYHYMPEVGEEPFHAFLGVPIIHHRRVLGVLVVQQRERRKFDESEEAFLITLSAQLATVIAHAEATGDVQELTNAEHERVDARFEGLAGSPGVAVGSVVVMHPPANLEAVPDRQCENITVELIIFDRAVNSVRNDIRRISEQFSESLPREELALFDVYLHMLDDDALTGDIRDRIRRGQWAQGALKQVIAEHLRRFQDMEDEYLRERASDVRDLGLRVLAYLQDIRAKKVHFPKDTVLVGEDVTPGMLANIPSDHLAGIVSLGGSGNSHVAILARALDIPAVMGAVDVPLYQIEGQRLVVDGHYGEVYTNPSEKLQTQFASLGEEEREFAEELDELKPLKCITRDGYRTLLWVNIGLTGDISRSLDRGAEGIGLFRTEVPFMTQDRFPTEEEQRVLYRGHMEAFEPRPVTMRTLDVGGDKSLSYFPIAEENPFLGWRGIRVTLDHPEIFLAQVRAMIKANAGLDGLLRIMLPMVSSMGEVDDAMDLVKRAYREVVEEGVEVKEPSIGVMVEVPSAVYQSRELARRVDFLAVGSNDLTQYMLAVDRNNPRVAELYQDTHPAVLRALREVARNAHAEGKGIGICGELAGAPIGAVLLMAMGYQVLSMNATNLPKVKWVLRNIKRSDARRMVARVLKMDTAEEISAYMQNELVAAGLGRVVPSHRDHHSNIAVAGG